MANRLKDTILALSNAGVQFVVAGGVAAVLHGVERVTLDIDLAVQMAPGNVRRFLQVIAGLGLTPRAPVPPAILLDDQAREQLVQEKHALVFTFLDPADPLWQVDVFLTTELSFENLNADAVTVAIQGHPVRVVSIPRLIELKQRVQPLRAKDQLDIVELQRILGTQP
jgi:hypothetical protein